MDAVDDVAFLAASRQRATIVATLHEEGPLPKDDLVGRTDAARVTVGRNLDRLAERGVVHRDGEAYALTLVGEMLVGPFLSLVETAEAAADLAPVLAHVPPDEFDLDPGALADADVTVSTRADPYAPVERHGRTLETAAEARLLLPAVSADPMGRTVDRIVAGDLVVEYVASTDVAATLRSDEFADRVERMVDSGNLSIRVYDGEVPYYLGLIDGAVQLGVDADGIPRALAESDSPTVHEWATETYESYRAAADPW